MDRELIVEAFKKILNDEEITTDELSLIKEFICGRYLFSSAGEVMQQEINDSDISTIKKVFIDCILHEINNSLLIRFGQ